MKKPKITRDGTYFFTSKKNPVNIMKESIHKIITTDGQKGDGFQVLTIDCSVCNTEIGRIWNGEIRLRYLYRLATLDKCMEYIDGVELFKVFSTFVHDSRCIDV